MAETGVGMAESGVGTAESGGRRRQHRPASRVGLMLGSLLDPAARRRGFATAALLTEWETIVGAGLAGRCRPVRVRHAPGGGQGGASLELAASGGAAMELQYAAPQLMQRINTYFGGTVVSRIVIRQWPRPPAPPAQPVPAPPDETTVQAVRAATSGVEDDGLRDALAQLGLRVAAARDRR